MMRFSLIWIFIFSFVSLKGQGYDCYGTRFLNSSFNSINSTIDIPYRIATTIGGVETELTLNVYRPFNDSLSERPLIVFIHGGGFVSGNKNEIFPLCEEFTQKGYVTASIDYRLIDIPIVDSSIINEGMIMAVSDAKVALEYLVNDAISINNFGIDTANIFVGGVSAGAITALHLAYLDSTDIISNDLLFLIEKHQIFEHSNTNYTRPPIKGVINYSGALWENKWISSGEPVLFSAHDELDPLVPCGNEQTITYNFNFKKYGSCMLLGEAINKNVINESFILPESTQHAGYLFDKNQYSFTIKKTSKFLYNIFCNKKDLVPIINKNVMTYPNPATDKFTLETTGYILPYELNIYDSKGELVYKNQVTTSKFNLLVREFQKGIFFYTIHNSLQSVSGKFSITQ